MIVKNKTLNDDFLIIELDDNTVELRVRVVKHRLFRHLTAL